MGEASNENQFASMFLWPQFQDPDTERAYIEEIASKNAVRVKVGTRLAFLFLILLVASFFLVTPSQEWSVAVLWVVFSRAGHGVMILGLLQLTPPPYLEYVLTLGQTVNSCRLFALNAFRRIP